MNRRESLHRWGKVALLGGISGVGAGSLIFKPTNSWAQSNADEARLLRAGACVVMLRHAQTDPGVGDPPEFDLAQCRTQRNLSAQGRTQARQIGVWFNTRQLTPRAVQSSPWCRCKDTADLAFGGHTVLPALSSTFGHSNAEPSQTEGLRALLAAIPPGQFDIWVTHQVNITALTGENASMGEAVVVGSGGKTLLRTRFG